jgi:hypothetical protein
MTLIVFRNFCRVLKNSPKHLKIYLYESCPLAWGTQLSCRLAFKNWKGKMWKTWSNDSTSCSPTHIGIQSWQASPAKSIEKKPHMAFVKVVGGSEIYNFCIQSFVHLYSKNWSFSISNTGTLSRCRPERRRTATSRAPACRVPQRPRPRSPPAEAARRPRPRTFP